MPDPRSTPARRYRLVRRRRPLEVEDVLVVRKSRIRTAVGGTVVGNFMEWFDFGVYGYMALTLADLFFQTGSESLDRILALFGFAVSFLVRPLGGLVLGPLGDRIGRQKVLFFTMAAMAIATALIGVLPTHAQIGVWAAFLLYALKLVQGFSTGGEYAGASTYVAEFSSDRRRGYFSSWLDVGSYLGFAAGAGTVALTHLIVGSGWGETAFSDWGWRIPFLIAIPLGAVAIWFRARIPETPAFEAIEETGAAGSADGQASSSASADGAAVSGSTAVGSGASAGDPSAIPASAQAAIARSEAEDERLTASGLRALLTHHRKALLIAIVYVAAGNTVGYALTSYMPTFLGVQLGMDEMQAAAATIPALVILALSLPFIGRLSDRVGRKTILWAAVILTLVLTVPAFLMMLTGSFWLIQVAMLIIAIPTALYLAMFAPTLPALFPTAARYAAMGLAFNISVSLFGGTTPMISQALIDLTGNELMPAFWIMFFSLLMAAVLPFMPETAHRPLLGSFPTVEEPEEAEALVERQHEDPLVDLETMPLEAEMLAVPVTADGTPVPEAEPVPVADLPVSADVLEEDPIPAADLDAARES